MKYESWGRYPQCRHLAVHLPRRPGEVLPAIRTAETAVLPRGLGRSYGDSCLNANGTLILSQGLDKFMHFEPESGSLRCEAGVALAEILRVFVPAGWFLPVTPGTKHVSVGGAIANDVHGKNHHGAGSFGHYVTQLELLRSSGERIICSRESNADWFRATIGGLGLTGFILWAEISLRRIPGPYLHAEFIRFSHFEEFLALSRESRESYEYTVAWLDCAGRGEKFGRGLYLRGNHAEAPTAGPPASGEPPAWRSLPAEAPSWLLSKPVVRAFNSFYYHQHLRRHRRKALHYEPFFYPLDGLQHWNRLYGRGGFLQWQCVVPDGNAQGAVNEILCQLTASELTVFLTVLKEFGEREAPGMLSFPMPGLTLTLDFPLAGSALFDLLVRLDEIVCAAGGRIYPAKDARMSSATFATAFPAIAAFERFVDPKFSSSFYRRVRRGS